jgi:hypothetical protein
MVWTPKEWCSIPVRVYTGSIIKYRMMFWDNSSNSNEIFTLQQKTVKIVAGVKPRIDGSISFIPTKGLELMTSGVLLKKLLIAHLFIPKLHSPRTYEPAIAICCLGRTKQLINSHPISSRPILIVLCHLRLGLTSGVVPSRLSYRNVLCICSLSSACYMPRPSHLSWLY